MSSEISRALDVAQETARRPVQERLDGLLGDEAEEAAVRVMTAAGLSYVDAHRVVSSIHWAGWKAGYRACRDGAFKA